MGFCNKPRCFVIVCAVTAVILIVITAISYPLLDKYVTEGVKKNVVIQPGSQVYDVWKGGKSLPVYFEIYMFNLTNEEDVIYNGSKPHVKQCGPYVYREYREKKDIVFHHNDTVSYREVKFYVFDRSLSVGPDSDLINTISIPLITLLTFLTKFSVPGLGEFLKRVIKEDIFITHSVRELVFGYEDELLKAAAIFHLVDGDKVGVLYGKNGSDDGLYTVFTGQKDIAKLGIIDKWNGKSSLDIWSRADANMINGTDGTLAPPFVVNKDFVTEMFTTDLCRSVSAIYSKNVEHHGVQLYRFEAPAAEFANATENPKNAGFCVPAGNCFGSGVLDEHKCISMNGVGIPIFSSNPHFQFADQRYIDAIVGINPKLPDLNTAIDIEPTTGLILKASKRLQINLYINNTKYTKNVLGKVPTMIYPIMWVNETGSADKAHTQQVGSQLNMIAYAHIAQIVLFAISGLLLIAAIVVFGVYPETRRRKSEEETPLLQDNESATSIQ